MLRPEEAAEGRGTPGCHGPVLLLLLQPVVRSCPCVQAVSCLLFWVTLIAQGLLLRTDRCETTSLASKETQRESNSGLRR